MKYLKSALLRQEVLSKVQQNCSIEEIEKSLDVFVDSIIENHDPLSWENIPLSFNFKAQDMNGDWYAYVNKPRAFKEMGSWISIGGIPRMEQKIIGFPQLNLNWEKTLEKRPNAKQ